MKNQKGFTLVEMSIVLVIIGLLLGGVLKGQELIKNAKVKGIANDVNAISAAMNAYQDRYHALPGDDAQASAHVNANAKDGNGNGYLEGGVGGDGALSGEVLEFFRDLSYANLLSPSISASNAIMSSFGVPMYVQHNTWGSGMGVLNVCFINLPGEYVRLYEMAYDDGYRDGGRVLTQTRAAGAPSVPQTIAGDAGTYYMCVAIN
jgi:prepilin-type N-terminal cleavage/methylation domain-containing protein